MVSVPRARPRRKSEEIVSGASALRVWVVALSMSWHQLIVMVGLEPAATLGLVLRSCMKLLCKNHCPLEREDLEVVGAQAR